MASTSSAFECGICASLYNAGSRQPLVLECGHTFCRQCLRGELRGAGGGRCCAYCRAHIARDLDCLPR